MEVLGICSFCKEIHRYGSNMLNILVKGTVLRSHLDHLATLDTSRNSRVILCNFTLQRQFSCRVTVRNKTSRSQVISVVAGSSGVATARCSVAGSAGLAVGVSSDLLHQNPQRNTYLVWTRVMVQSIRMAPESCVCVVVCYISVCSSGGGQAFLTAAKDWMLLQSAT